MTESFVVRARKGLVRAERATQSFDGDSVERIPGSNAPRAFRIWTAGENPTDHGMTIFSAKSAELLMTEQTVRGNLYSIDVGHASLDPAAPLENQRAVGWHRLEVRDGDLWAVDVEWSQWVACGFDKTPPEWRYFSPAYDVDPESCEVVSYTNTAVTNVPATWNVTALASRGDKTPEREETRMSKYEDAMAAIKKMAEGDDEDAHKAKAAYAAMTKHEAQAAADAVKEAKEAAEAPPASSKAPDSKKDPAPLSKKSDAKKDAKDPAMVLATRVQELEAKFASLETVEERKRLLASRPDLAPDVAKWLEKSPIETVREAIKVLPRTAKNPAAAAQPGVQATRGEGQAEGASRLPPDEKAELDRRMGLGKRQDAVVNKGIHQEFRVVPRVERAVKGGDK